VAVLGGFTFSTISTWGQHTCGLTVSGATYCWGRNSYGQLGNGSTDSSPVPVPVTGGLSFYAVTGGLYHTCGLTVSGAAYCWGRNGYGQLGNGSTDSSSVPLPVTGGLSFSAITAGRFHTCGLTTDGVAYCWGDNSAGQLGDGSFTIAPRLVPTGVAGGLTFSSVTAGGLHTCALATTGVAYCWGFNSWGQLGNGTGFGFDSAMPVRVLGQP
jgi:alpha-tubulin suppressor-like RCC1 family protein